MSDTKKDFLNIPRVTLISAVMSVLMTVLLFLRGSLVEELFEKLEKIGSDTNLEWVLRYGSAALPIIVLVTVLSVFYSGKGSTALINKEKLIIFTVVAVFTYAFLLPFSMSKAVPSQADAEETVRFFDLTAKWFFAQIIPFLIVLVYHYARIDAGNETEQRKEDENED